MWCLINNIKIEQTLDENYYIQPNTYDYIVAVSSLEHVQSEEDLKRAPFYEEGTKATV